MLSLFSIISAPSSPTTSSAPRRAPEPSRREPLTGIIADASKYEVTIVRYMECPVEDDADYDSDATVDEERRSEAKAAAAVVSKPDWDEKDWDEDAAEWTGPDW